MDAMPNAVPVVAEPDEEMGFAVIDFETGGFNFAGDALMSVGVLVMDRELHEVQRFYTLIRDDPERRINPDAQKINGISLKEIEEQGAPVAEVLEELANILRYNIPVAHNAPFDMRWLRERGIQVTQAIDTMMLAMGMWPNERAKLGMVAERMGIEVKDAHNAMGDVLMTAEVLRRMAAKNPKVLEPREIDFEYWEKRRR